MKMLELLKEQPADNIIALMGQFASDNRATKVDLGVGVYKNQSGVTPIMGAVKKAQALLLEDDLEAESDYRSAMEWLAEVSGSGSLS